MLMADDGDGYVNYFGRNEGAGVTYAIDVSGADDQRVKTLLETITCTAEDVGNEDAPWPWEGEAFTGETLSVDVADFTLTAEFLPMSESLVTYDAFNQEIEIIGDKLYVISNYELREYTYDGSSLTFNREIELDGNYQFVENADGMYAVSGFMCDMLICEGDTELSRISDLNNFTLAPDGMWGVSWYSAGETCKRFGLFSDNSILEPFPFNEVGSISALQIDENYVYVTGSPAEGSGHYVYVYDHNGAFKMKLEGEPDGFSLGAVKYVTGTENGFIGFDANMRTVILWSADGTWLGQARADELFGADYPWISTADVADDGSILVGMSQLRDDESADEVLVFKLSGF